MKLAEKVQLAINEANLAHWIVTLPIVVTVAVAVVSLVTLKPRRMSQQNVLSGRIFFFSLDKRKQH